VTGKKIKKRLKKDVCADVDRRGYSVPGKTIKKLQDMATAANLPITVKENDVVEGWLESQKKLDKLQT
jgi:hypothetical protein